MLRHQIWKMKTRASFRASTSCFNRIRATKSGRGSRLPRLRMVATGSKIAIRIKSQRCHQWGTPLIEGSTRDLDSIRSPMIGPAPQENKLEDLRAQPTKCLRRKSSWRWVRPVSTFGPLSSSLLLASSLLFRSVERSVEEAVVLRTRCSIIKATPKHLLSPTTIFKFQSFNLTDNPWKYVTEINSHLKKVTDWESHWIYNSTNVSCYYGEIKLKKVNFSSLEIKEVNIQ